MLRFPEVECPYCGQRQTIPVDCSSEVQNYYEDCEVCCRPMAVTATCSYEGELLDVDVQSETDATNF